MPLSLGRDGAAHTMKRALKIAPHDSAGRLAADQASQIFFLPHQCAAETRAFRMLNRAHQLAHTPWSDAHLFLAENVPTDFSGQYPIGFLGEKLAGPSAAPVGDEARLIDEPALAQPIALGSGDRLDIESVCERRDEHSAVSLYLPAIGPDVDGLVSHPTSPIGCSPNPRGSNSSTRTPFSQIE